MQGNQDYQLTHWSNTRAQQPNHSVR